MASAKTENAVAEMKATDSQLPAYLQGQAKTSKVGNIDSTDLIIPRVKLLQAISPEVVESNSSDAKAGQFWHTIANEAMGDVIVGVPIVVRKSVVLWAPRGDDRGVLARSSDCVNWDKGFENLEFEVKPKGVPKPFKLFTDKDVRSSGLTEFGTGIPGDPQSAPAASITYNFMWYFPDFDEFSPAIIINTRAAIKPARLLLSNIEQNPVDHYYRKFLIKSVDGGTSQEPFKNYAYQADGYIDEALAAKTKQLFEQFSAAGWRANEETDEAPVNEGGAGGEVGGKSNKF